jgi:hypothetical protein
MTAHAVKYDTKRLIYLFKGVSSFWEKAVKLAICPIKVLSPVANTTPLPTPYLFNVEKKTMFFDYKVF